MPRCLLPQSEQAELRYGVTNEMKNFCKYREILVQIFKVATPYAPEEELEVFETHLELLLQAHENLISAQNIAIKAGLTAEGR